MTPKEKLAMASDGLLEEIARIIDPASWSVMDRYLADMLRQHKGKNIGYDPEAFKHRPSMIIAKAVIDRMQERVRAETERLNPCKKCGFVAEKTG